MVLPLPERGAAMTRPRARILPSWPASFTRRRFLSDERPEEHPSRKANLRKGWTTGACAAAATRAAYEALVCGQFPGAVAITLPGGARPSFALALEELGEGFARAGIIKDAGDDPDVTHGALVIARVSHGPPGSGVVFRAGEGIGTVTRAGLPLVPGEPAINPAPRRMINA